jgi:Amt family ammonium transporter
MLQSFIAMGVISLLWVVVGFSSRSATASAASSAIRAPSSCSCAASAARRIRPSSPTIPLMLFALFQLKFAIITPALITGSFAERVRFSSYVLFMVLFSPASSTRRSRTGPGTRDGFLRKSGACSTSPAAPSCT